MINIVLYYLLGYCITAFLLVQFYRRVLCYRVINEDQKDTICAFSIMFPFTIIVLIIYGIYWLLYQIVRLISKF